MDRRYGRPELVRSVGEEQSRGRLGRPRPHRRRFERVDHLVEGGGHTTQFRVEPGRRQATAQFAGRDSIGNVGHVPQRTEHATGHDYQQQSAQDDEHEAGADLELEEETDRLVDGLRRH